MAAILSGLNVLIGTYLDIGTSIYQLQCKAYFSVT